MKKIFALCLIPIVADAAEECKKPACNAKHRVVRIEPKKPKELMPGATLYKFLGTCIKDVETSKDQTVGKLSKEEMLTLLTAAQATALDLAKKPETRDFIAECGSVANAFEKLVAKLPPALATSYEQSEVASAFLELLFITCMPNNSQAMQVKEDTLKKLAKTKKAPEPKKESRCVIL